MKIKNNCKKDELYSSSFIMFKGLKSKKMIKNETSCIRFSDRKICPSCSSNHVIKNGFTANKKQQFICKSCKNRLIDFLPTKHVIIG